MELLLICILKLVIVLLLYLLSGVLFARSQPLKFESHVRWALLDRGRRNYLDYVKIAGKLGRQT